MRGGSRDESVMVGADATLVVGGCVVEDDAGCRNGAQVDTVVIGVGTGLLHDPGGEKADVKAEVRAKVKAEMETEDMAKAEVKNEVDAEVKDEVDADVEVEADVVEEGVKIGVEGGVEIGDEGRDVEDTADVKNEETEWSKLS